MLLFFNVIKIMHEEIGLIIGNVWYHFIVMLIVIQLDIDRYDNYDENSVRNEGEMYSLTLL